MEIGFTIVFAFCAIILLLMMRFANIHWLFKASMIVSSIGVVFLFYYSLVDVLGYPVSMGVPKDVILIKGFDIREPSKMSKGDIYLWFIVQDDKNELPLPRAIRLPYTKELHKKLTEAAEQGKKGKNVFMQFSDKKRNKIDGPEISSEEEIGAEVDFVMPKSHVPPKIED